MSKSITQDMAYRQSLMKYVEKHGVKRASRKYNKSRSYIYFWKARWDGTAESLACRSRRPHSHPNQHTEAELKLIWDMRRRNPQLGMVELWHRLRQRGYTRRPESLFRVMRKLGLFPPKEKKPACKPKPYQQMTYPGQRIQVDVKVVPRHCIADPELRLFQYTAIDEFTRLRFLAAYPEQSTYSSADFLKKLFKWYARRGIRVECVQTDNGFEFTNRFIIKPKREADLDYLSESDLECLDHAIAICKDKDFGELTNLSHDLAWQNTQRDRAMSVKDILREAGDDEEYVNYIAGKLKTETSFHHGLANQSH